ncbi:hypothetical protein SLE2022_163490 [Rubroshorea leprosula]
MAVDKLREKLLESSEEKQQRIRRSKAENISCSLSPDHMLFPDTNATKIGGEETPEEKGKMCGKMVNRKRHITMLEIEELKAYSALKKMKAKVKKKKEETNLMKSDLEETIAAVEEKESMLYQMKTRLNAMILPAALC